MPIFIFIIIVAIVTVAAVFIYKKRMVLFKYVKQNFFLKSFIDANTSRISTVCQYNDFGCFHRKKAGGTVTYDGNNALSFSNPVISTKEVNIIVKLIKGSSLKVSLILVAFWPFLEYRSIAGV